MSAEATSKVKTVIANAMVIAFVVAIMGLIVANGVLSIGHSDRSTIATSEDRGRTAGSVLFVSLFIQQFIDELAWRQNAHVPEHNQPRMSSHWLVIGSLIPSSQLPLFLRSYIALPVRFIMTSLGLCCTVFGVLGKMKLPSTSLSQLLKTYAFIGLFTLSEVALHCAKFYSQDLLNLACGLKVVIVLSLAFSASLRHKLLQSPGRSENFFADRRYVDIVLLLALVGFLCWDVYYSFHLVNSQQAIDLRIVSHVLLVLLTALLPGRLTRRGLLVAEANTSMQQEMNYKKTFVRYISHEVRSPLSTANLALDCMIQILSRTSAVSLVSSEITYPATGPASSQSQSLASVLSLPPSWAEDLLELAQDCKESCTTAIHTLSDLLLYDKIENRMLSLECLDVDVSAFLGHCVHPLEKQIELSGLQWKVDVHREVGHCLLHIDPIKMEQVLRNFISNALKFTPSGGKITLTACIASRHLPGQLEEEHEQEQQQEEEEWVNEREKVPVGSPVSTAEPLSPEEVVHRKSLAAARKAMAPHACSSSCGGADPVGPSSGSSTPLSSCSSCSTTSSSPASPSPMLRVSVTDTGPGVSLSDQARLFSSYVQLQANKLQAGGGSGLGLWLSRAIVEAHGGCVGMYSAGEGCGSSFYFELPVEFLESREEEEEEDVPLPVEEEKGSVPPTCLSPLSLPSSLAPSVLSPKAASAAGVSSRTESEGEWTSLPTPSPLLPTKREEDEEAAAREEEGSGSILAGATSSPAQVSPKSSPASPPRLSISTDLVDCLPDPETTPSPACLLSASLSSSSVAPPPSFFSEEGAASSSSSSSTVGVRLPLHILLADDAPLARKLVERMLLTSSLRVPPPPPPPPPPSLSLDGSSTPAVSKAGLAPPPLSTTRRRRPAGEVWTVSQPSTPATPLCCTPPLLLPTQLYSRTMNGNATHGGSFSPRASTLSCPSVPRTPAPGAGLPPQGAGGGEEEDMGTFAVTIDQAANGQVCVDKVLSSLSSPSTPPYDVLLIDLYMPVVDGPTAIRLLRSRGYTGLIFALTAAQGREEIDLLLQAGATAVMKKPFHVQGLQCLLNAFYHRASLPLVKAATPATTTPIEVRLPTQQ